MQKKYKALVLINHDLLREKVAGILSRLTEIWMTMQLSDPKNLIKACIQNKPEIVVVDISFALDESAIMKQIKVNLPDTIVVVFSDERTSMYDSAVKKAGADILVDASILERGVSSMLQKTAI